MNYHLLLLYELVFSFGWFWYIKVWTRDPHVDLYNFSTVMFDALLCPSVFWL